MTTDVRKLVSALAALAKEQVEKIVRAADASRSVEALMATLAPPVTRKKRGPNKPKPEVAAAPPAPVKKSHHKKPAAFGSALDRVKGLKSPGLKTRKSPAEREDED